MATIEISSVNYNNQYAIVTFYPNTGGTVDFGYQLIPCFVELDYYFGTFSLFFSTFNKTCEIIVPPVGEFFLLLEDGGYLLQEDLGLLIIQT